jgi:hypothetical protein
LRVLRPGGGGGGGGAMYSLRIIISFLADRVRSAAALNTALYIVRMFRKAIFPLGGGILSEIFSRVSGKRYGSNAGAAEG